MKSCMHSLQMATNYTIFFSLFSFALNSSDSLNFWNEIKECQCACRAMQFLLASDTFYARTHTHSQWVRQVRVTFVYNSLISIYNIHLNLTIFGKRLGIDIKTHTRIYCFIIIFNGYFSSNRNNNEVFLFGCCFVAIFFHWSKHVHFEIYWLAKWSEGQRMTNSIVCTDIKNWKNMK